MSDDGHHGDGRFVGQTVLAVSQNVGERGVDLDDRALLVADEEGLLQGVDQCRAPPRMVVAQPRQFDVGPHTREQFGRREWLDQVVVGACLQPFDGGLLPGAGGQQHDGHCRSPWVGTQRRDQGEAVEPGHHDVADDQVGQSGRDPVESLLAVGDGVDLVSGPAQHPGKVLTHIGVVIGDEDARGRVTATNMELRIVGSQRRLSHLGGSDVVVTGNPAKRLLHVGFGYAGGRPSATCRADRVGREMVRAERKADSEGGAHTLHTFGVDRVRRAG